MKLEATSSFRLCALAISTASLLIAASAHAQCASFNLTQSSGVAIDPGSADIGNHCDDCTTTVNLPFSITMYGATYSTCKVCSNGNIQFTTDNGEYNNSCLPRADILGVAMCPHWDDLMTDGAGEGIFTSIRGVSPNRIFNIEWRAHYYSGGGSANFEARLFEDNSHIEFVYGALGEGGSSATVGVQHISLPATQFACNTAGLLPAGTRLSLACYNGPVGAANASPNPVYACGSQGTTLLTVNVVPGSNPTSTGITVRADLGAIGGTANQSFYNDGTHGDVTANDSIWSFQILVPPTIAPGDKSLAYVLADAQGRSTNGAIGLHVNPCPSTGPDVIVDNLLDMNYYGAEGNISAYSIGTDACNRGDYPVYWLQGGTTHPVIAQNLFRLKNNRFEQIGQSFLKHGFQSLNSPGCATCVQPPLGGAQLGVGCSDAYGAGYNGSQGNLGMRSTCNATTGVYSWPPPPPPGNIIGQRLQVFTSDIDPAQNPGAIYFGEGHYVTADDAQWTHAGAPAVNGLNNATYRRLTVTDAVTAPQFVGNPQLMSPAIQAWKDVDSSVTIAPTDYLDTSLPGPGIVSRFWVAAKATDNGNGTWHYEYAVYNLNADRAGGSFSVPIAPGAVVSNIAFHGVFAHSGEPYPNTAAHIDAWTGVASATSVTWTCPEPFSGNGNNANAIRWGTMYNFRFDATVAPSTGPVTVGLFKPGVPSSISAEGIAIPGPICRADFNHDGVVDFFDYLDFVNLFATGAGGADFNRDGVVDFFDYLDFVQVFSVGC